MFKKKYLFAILLLLPILTFCSFPKREKVIKDLSNNDVNHQSININLLRISLYNADKKLTPKIIRNNDGSFTYRYIKKPGEGKISLKEVKKRILLGPNFYKNDREEIIRTLKRLNELKINNKLDYIDNKALGLWIPSKDIIIIDYRAIEMGSPTFLNILSHEVIHVAQSCFSGSRKKFPERIGLPLEYSKDLNIKLSNNLYKNKSEEVMSLEREAFTYSKVEGAAIKLLNNFCE